MFVRTAERWSWHERPGATCIDSTGLGALIEGYRAAVEAESRFVVVNPTSSFRRVLVVTGLDDLFGVATEGTAQPDVAI
jgi:anti-sigma B factor antagonist